MPPPDQPSRAALERWLAECPELPTSCADVAPPVAERSQRALSRAVSQILGRKIGQQRIWQLLHPRRGHPSDGAPADPSLVQAIETATAGAVPWRGWYSAGRVREFEAAAERLLASREEDRP